MELSIIVGLLALGAAALTGIAGYLIERNTDAQEAANAAGTESDRIEVSSPTRHGNN